MKGSPYKMVKGVITQDLEQGVVEKAPSRFKILLTRQRFEQIIDEHMSNNQFEIFTSRDEALEHGWNPAYCSFNLNLKFGDPFTVERR